MDTFFVSYTFFLFPVIGSFFPHSTTIISKSLLNNLIIISGTNADLTLSSSDNVKFLLSLFASNIEKAVLKTIADGERFTWKFYEYRIYQSNYKMTQFILLINYLSYSIFIHVNQSIDLTMCSKNTFLVICIYSMCTVQLFLKNFYF